MQPRIFQGRTVDDAIANGLKQLEIASREDANIKIVQEARNGFLGIGAKHAVIEITVPEWDKKDAFISETVQTADKDEPIMKSEAVAELVPVIEVLDKVDSEQIEDFEIETASEVDRVSKNEDKQDDEDSDGEINQSKCFDVDYVAEYLISVCESYLAPVRIDVEDLGHQITYSIITDKPGLVIGKHGKIVNSLETLAQVLTHRHVRNRVKVEVNVGDYRQRRQATLERLADRTAEKVKQDKQPVFLEPLPASERKIIHNQLARYQYVVTHSEGKEPHRYLVIEYK